MPEVNCQACNTPHEPNEYAPYCCSRCRTFGRRRTANRSARPYSAADAERAQLRRDVGTLQATVVTQRTFIAGLQRRASRLQGQLNRLWALYRRLRLRWQRRRL